MQRRRYRRFSEYHVCYAGKGADTQGILKICYLSEAVEKSGETNNGDV